MKRRDVLIHYLSKHINKIIIGASYCVLLLFLLTLAPGILYEERLIKEGVWQENRKISNEWFTITYSLNTGYAKPLIRFSSDDELVSLISVNGFKSSVQIDNAETRSFWNHTFRNVVKEGAVRHTMLWDNYQLMQRTTLQENTVVIDYRIKTCGGEDNFNLTLNLWHEYQETSLLKIDNTYINDNYWGETENQPEPTYVVLMQTNRQPDSIENAPYWAELTYSFENLAVGEAWGNSIVEVTISYSSWEEIAEPENSL